MKQVEETGGEIDSRLIKKLTKNSPYITTEVIKLSNAVKLNRKPHSNFFNESDWEDDEETEVTENQEQHE